MAEVKKYNHLFFDLDHTLWDFDLNSRETLTDLFSKYELHQSLKTEPDNFVSTYFRINEEKWKLYRKGSITKADLRKERFFETFLEFGLNDEEFSHQFEVEYIDLCPHKTALLPYTLEILDYLKDDYQLHIITNGFSEIQDIKLSKSGLKPYFDKIISSDYIGVNKPGAAIFIESLKLAGANRKESLMIGDNLGADIIGARNCGIDQVYFNPELSIHEEKVTYEISNLKELKKIL